MVFYLALELFPVWTYVLIAAYSVLAIAIVLSLLVHGVRPAKTLAWLLAIFTIPVGGLLLYWMLGRNRRKHKMKRLQQKLLPLSSAFLDPELYRDQLKYERLMRLINNACQIPPVRGNQVEFLIDGKSTFESIFLALEQAQKSIHLQYYIFEEGDLADRLGELFLKKSRQGVRIRLIYDEVGSFSLSRAYRKKLRKAGIEVFAFLPFRFSRLLSGLNYRNHRKIITIDGKVAFTGGINISDKYLSGDHLLGPWHDAHLRIEGPAVASLEKIFAMDWLMVSGQKLETSPPLPVAADAATQRIVQIVPSGPDDKFPVIEQVLLRLILEARDYLYITNPYIIPSQEILKGLQIAALSGVDVRLLVSEQSDSRIVNWSVRSYFEPLLRSGVRIFQYPHGFLHSKIIVSDNDISTVGTANIDVRSFEHNYEVNALVYDRHFAMELRTEFLRDCAVSKELVKNQFYGRPIGQRLKEGAARILSPLL